LFVPLLLIALALATFGCAICGRGNWAPATVYLLLALYIVFVAVAFVADATPVNHRHIALLVLQIALACSLMASEDLRERMRLLAIHAKHESRHHH
jgi:O-antigen/teichoic acid export membrane protein